MILSNLDISGVSVDNLNNVYEVGFVGLAGVYTDDKLVTFYIKKKDGTIDAISYKLRDIYEEVIDSKSIMEHSCVGSISLGMFSSMVDGPLLYNKYVNTELMNFSSKEELFSYMARSMSIWISANTELLSVFMRNITALKEITN